MKDLNWRDLPANRIQYDPGAVREFAVTAKHLGSPTSWRMTIVSAPTRTVPAAGAGVHPT